MKFLKNNWIYILVTFAIVFLIGIGYITYTRLNQINNQKLLQDKSMPTSPSEQPAGEAELTFQITPSLPNATGLSCIELVASPLGGPVPLKVTFTGLAEDTADTIQFNFDFGDGSTISKEKKITSNDGKVTQIITHTYTTENVYTATLSVESENGTQRSPSCSIEINAGIDNQTIDLIQQNQEKNQTPSPYTSPIKSVSLTPTPTLTSSTILDTEISSVSPTKTVIAQTSPTSTLKINNSNTTTQEEEIPAPNVPKAGSLFPTTLMIVGGLLVLILAFAVI